MKTVAKTDLLLIDWKPLCKHTEIQAFSEFKLLYNCLASKQDGERLNKRCRVTSFPRTGLRPRRQYYGNQKEVTATLWKCLFSSGAQEPRPLGRTSSPAPPIIFKLISASAGMKRVLLDATDTMELDSACNFPQQNA